MKQTAIQLLKENIDFEIKLGTKMVINWNMYLAMEREQIINAHIEGQPFATCVSAKAENYYNETYKNKL